MQWSLKEQGQVETEIQIKSQLRVICFSRYKLSTKNEWREVNISAISHICGFISLLLLLLERGMNTADNHINSERPCNKCEPAFLPLLDWYLCFIEKDTYSGFCKVFPNDMKNFHTSKKGSVKKPKNNKRIGQI